MEIGRCGFVLSTAGEDKPPNSANFSLGEAAKRRSRSGTWLLSRARRSPNDRRHKTQDGRRSALARAPMRVSVVAQNTLAPAGGRTTAAPAGSVVGSGALCAVAMLGAECAGVFLLKVRFFGFGTPLPGTSTRAIAVRRGGCEK